MAAIALDTLPHVVSLNQSIPVTSNG